MNGSVGVRKPLAARPVVLIYGDPCPVFDQLTAVVGTSNVVLVADVQAAAVWLQTQLGTSDDAEILHVSNLELDMRRFTVRSDGRPVHLSLAEFRAFTALAQDGRHAWTFAQLANAVWRQPYFGDSSTIRSLVKRLRKKLADARADVSIDSVRGVGFRLTVR